MYKVSIDLGYGWTKALSQEGGAVSFPSVVGPGHDRMPELVSPDPADIHVEVDGEEFFVGELARKESLGGTFTLERNKIRHRSTSVLLATAAAMTVPGSVPQVFLATGLPVLDYAAQKEEMENFLSSFRARVRFIEGPLAGEVREVRFARVLVFPQAAGAVYSVLRSPDGRVRYGDFLKDGSMIGAVDVGFKTTDFVVFEAGRSLKLRSDLCGTVDAGVYDLYRPLMMAFTRKTGGRLDDTEVEELVRDGSIFYAGRERIFTREIAAAKESLSRKIRDRVEAHWGRKSDFLRAVFLVGGGALLLAQELSGLHPMVIPVDDPQWANARGFLAVAAMAEEAERRAGIPVAP